MYSSLYMVAMKNKTFTNDDVFDHYDAVYPYHSKENDNRQFGPVVQKALRQGVMTWTGDSVVSRRPKLKMFIKVWESNVYKESFWTKVKNWFNNTF